MAALAELPPLVARWDLDKTYLRTDFYTLRDLARSAFERPDQKRPVPGAARLLAELGRDAARIHILSGSPEQMRRSIAERLAMDGVHFDELTLKPHLKNLLRLRWGSLKDQLGYKLPALLEARQKESPLWDELVPAEVLVGDDSEADAFVYSLYADVVSGAISVAKLEQVLTAGGTFDDDRRRTLAAAERVSGSAPADRFLVLIHLDRQTPPSRFLSYGLRLVPFYNYAQAALVLLDRGLVRAEAVYRVAAELVEQHRFDRESLARSYWDLRRRSLVGGELLDRLKAGRPERGELASVAGLPEAILQDPLEAQPRSHPPPPAPLDYEELAQRHRGGKNRR